MWEIKSVDELQRVCRMGRMKKQKTSNKIKIERPPRATISTEEALKRMKEFSKRKEQFLATARTGKS